jgi:hypothetical protein
MNGIFTVGQMMGADNLVSLILDLEVQGVIHAKVIIAGFAKMTA